MQTTYPRVMTPHIESNAIARDGGESMQAVAPEQQQKLAYRRTELAEGVPAEFLPDRPRPAGTLSSEKMAGTGHVHGRAWP